MVGLGFQCCNAQSLQKLRLNLKLQAEKEDRSCKKKRSASFGSYNANYQKATLYSGEEESLGQLTVWSEFEARPCNTGYFQSAFLMVLIKQEKGAANNVGHYLRSVFLILQNTKLTGTLISQNN